MADTFVGPVHEKATSAVVGKGNDPLQTLDGKLSEGAVEGEGVEVMVGVAVGAVAVAVGEVGVLVLVGAVVGVSVCSSAAAGGLPPGRIATTLVISANAASRPRKRNSIAGPPVFKGRNRTITRAWYRSHIEKLSKS
jgi:hypothetical protein